MSRVLSYLMMELKERIVNSEFVTLEPFEEVADEGEPVDNCRSHDGLARSLSDCLGQLSAGVAHASPSCVFTAHRYSQTFAQISLKYEICLENLSVAGMEKIDVRPLLL